MSGSVSEKDNPTNSDTFTREGVLSGSVITQGNCLKTPDTSSWVNVGRKRECVRYFHSGLSEDQQNEEVFVFFGGDVMIQSLDGEAFVLKSYEKYASEEHLQRKARDISHYIQKPVILLSRPGVLGSSGSHKDRRLPRESAIISTVLNDIKKRYGIQNFILAGQSGGGHVVAALLTRRNDISCAIMASGVVSVRQRARLKRWGDKDITGHTHFFDPIEYVDKIPQNDNRHIWVVTDPRDRIVPASTQAHYFNRVQNAGHNITLLKQAAPDKNHHILTEVSYDIARQNCQHAPG